MPDQDRNGVAVLGAGIGRAHVEALIRLPDRFRVAAVCDLDAERGRDLAALAEHCRVETDIEAVLSATDVDIVVVCLPPSLHTPVTVDALEAGKHVVCEKPFALSLDAADRMIQAAQASGRALAPVFQYRHGHGYRQLRHLVSTGLAGRALTASLETHWNRDTDYYAVPWRGTWAGEGGGAILSHAIHIHDMLTHALGPVARVTASLATRVNESEVDDCAAVALELAGGAVATSSITLGAADNTSRLRFCFSGVTAESGLDPYRPGRAPWTFTARLPTEQSMIDAAIRSVAAAPEGYVGFYAELDRTLRGETAEGVSLDDARRSIELVTALYRSARTGASIALPVSTDDPGYSGWAP